MGAAGVSLAGIAVNVTLLACQTRYMRRADRRAERLSRRRIVG